LLTRKKFFGEGTSLSQNLNAQQGLFGNSLDFFNTSAENLFTRKSFGGSLFASAPLSEFYRKRPFTQFSRVGLSYLFSTSSTEDPPVNASGNTNLFIPVVYRQPNIITSRVTGTFVYDARDYKGGIDPTSGRSLSIGMALAGLLGDVRTYQPSIEFTQFYPMRNKRTDHPHVFGFRIQAGTVGSLFGVSDKVKNANSLAFVDGVPIYERYFLGDEFSIRGYPPRVSARLRRSTFTSRRAMFFYQRRDSPRGPPPTPVCRLHWRMLDSSPVRRATT
jgi:outer membrane protein insertion porin family